MMSEKENLKKVIAREKRFASLAKTEGEGAMKRARSEKGANKKDSQMESKIDSEFSKVRTNLVQQAKKKLRKTNA
jgi:hypothetical protein